MVNKMRQSAALIAKISEIKDEDWCYKQTKDSVVTNAELIEDMTDEILDSGYDINNADSLDDLLDMFLDPEFDDLSEYDDDSQLSDLVDYFDNNGEDE